MSGIELRDAISQRYESALEAIADANNIVVYCGAGVSLSRTNLGWNDLINQVYKGISRKRHKDEKTKSLVKSCEDAIKDTHLLPVARATILKGLIAEYLKEKDSVAPEKQVDLELRKHVKNCLYQNNSRTGKSISLRRSRVDLLSYLVNMAVFFKTLNKNIIIVTTNYDTYIEDEVRVFCSNHKDYAVEVVPYCAPLGEDTPSFQVNKQLPIIYLHGRVAAAVKDKCKQSNESIPPLVFDESDYSASRTVTHATLVNLTKDADCLLILGSSLEDPPLLEFLHAKRRKKDEDTTGKTLKTIALKPFDPHPVDLERKKSEELLIEIRQQELRYRRIGIDHYVPFRTFSEVPLFLRDAVVELLQTTKKTAVSEKATRRHSHAHLASYCNLLDTKLSSPEQTNQLHAILASTRNTIAKEILSKKPPFGERASGIILKIEFWLRGVGKASNHVNQVVRVLDSESLLLDNSTARIEDYYRRFSSRTAAVRAMQFGRSSFVHLEALGEKSSASRWQAFFSAPIWTPPVTDDPLALLGIPVGALVICCGLEEDKAEHLLSKDKERFQQWITGLQKDSPEDLEMILSAYCDITSDLLFQNLTPDISLEYTRSRP